MCYSVSEYDNLFASYRDELTKISNYFYGKPQPINERTDLSSESEVYIINTLFKDCSAAGSGGQFAIVNQEVKFLLSFRHLVNVMPVVMVGLFIFLQIVIVFYIVYVVVNAIVMVTVNLYGLVFIIMKDSCI